MQLFIINIIKGIVMKKIFNTLKYRIFGKSVKKYALKLLELYIIARIKEVEGKKNVEFIDEEAVAKVVVKVICGEPLNVPDKLIVQKTLSSIVLNGKKIL